jgi:hypothetical protein
LELGPTLMTLNGAQSLQWGWRAPAVRVPAGQWLGFGYWKQ